MMSRAGTRSRVATTLPQRVLAVIGGIVALACLGAVVIAPLDLVEQSVFGAIGIVVMLVMNRNKSRAMSLALVILSVVVSTRYLYWRGSETLHFKNAFEAFLGSGLYLAEIYTWLIMLLGYFQSLWPLQRTMRPLPPDPADWPTVDVYVPTYNESLAVVRDTVLAAQNIDYPADRMKVWLLDDGRRDEFREFAAEAGVGYLAREDNAHAKAGNLNHALGKTDAELICVFDCDHAPTRAFLQMTVGFFLDDPKLALVQTPHHFYSPDPFERNLVTRRRVPSEGELFYGPVQQGNDLWNAAFFCGSCALIRRSALDETHGFAVETVTEDAHTALKLQKSGWNTVYLDVPLAAGLATERLALHIGQRARWARGMVQIFRLDNPLWGGKLRIAQRLCYLNAMLHFLFPLPRFVFLTAPLAYLLFGQNIIATTPWLLIAFVLPHLVHGAVTNTRLYGPWRHAFWGEIYETVLSFHLLRPVMTTLVAPKRGKFNVTEKGGLVPKDYFDRKTVMPHMIAVCVLLVAVVFGLVKLGMPGTFAVDAGSLWLNVAWASFNVMLMLAAIAVGWERRQQRENVRVPATLPVNVYFDDGRVIAAETRELSMGGMSLNVPDGVSAPSGGVTDVELPLPRGSAFFPVRLVTDKGRVWCLQIRGELPIQQRRDLVKIIMGRADAWVRPAREADRAWLSLLDIATAIAHLFPFVRRRRGQRRHVPARQEGPRHDTVVGHPRAIPVAARGAQGRPMHEPLAGAVARSMLLAMAFGASLAGVSGAARAADEVAPSVDVPVASDAIGFPDSSTRRVETIRLADLGATTPLTMRGALAERSLPFTLRADEVVIEAAFTLTLGYSPSLLPDLSSISILINDELVGNLRLDQAHSGGVTVEMPVNPALFLPRSRLGLRLVAHYTMECEDPLHSTLWAQVSNQSALRLVIDRLPGRSDLAYLPQPFFDAGDMRTLALPFVLPDGASNNLVQPAAVVASYFGVVAGFRGAKFPVVFDDIPEGNAVVFATGAEQPAGVALPKIDGPTIAIVDNPRNPVFKLLLVMGRTPEELRSAANTLALGSTALSGESALVGKPVIEPRKPYDAPRWIPTDRPVRFGEIADPLTLEGVGLSPGTLSLNFGTAPDLFVWRGDSVPLNLRYRYPSDQWLDREQSRLDVSANNKYLKSLPLSGPGPLDEATNLVGDDYVIGSAEVRVPPYLIYGKNQLQFYYDLKSTKVGECTGELPNNVRTAIDPDSTIDLSGTYHYAELPNLALFASSVFPFTRRADLGETAVVVPDRPDAAELETLFGVMGRAGDATGYPAVGVTLVRGTRGLASIGSKDILVVGSLDKRLGLTELTHDSVFQFDGSRLKVNLGGPVQRTWSALANGHWKSDVDKANQVLVANNGFSGIVSRISPWHGDRVVVMLVASQSQHLPDLVDRLREPEVNAALQGDLAIYDGDRAPTSFRVGPSMATGVLPAWAKLRMWFSNHPLLLTLLLFAGVALLAWIVYRAVRGLARRRLAGAEKS